MLYSYYPPHTRYPIIGHTVPRNGTPHYWQALFYDYSHQSYSYGECYQPPQLTHYQSHDFTSYSYPQYGQTYQETPPRYFYQPQWEGNYQEQWGENANYLYEENNQVEEIDRQQFMFEMMRQITELEERIDKLVIPEPQQKVISPPIENCYISPIIQPESQNDNEIELKDNSRYQLMTKLMSQMIEFNNLVKH